jgi:hypothetical protein
LLLFITGQVAKPCQEGLNRPPLVFASDRAAVLGMDLALVHADSAKVLLDLHQQRADLRDIRQMQSTELLYFGLEVEDNPVGGGGHGLRLHCDRLNMPQLVKKVVEPVAQSGEGLVHLNESPRLRGRQLPQAVEEQPVGEFFCQISSRSEQ